MPGGLNGAGRGGGAGKEVDGIRGHFILFCKLARAVSGALMGISTHPD